MMVTRAEMEKRILTVYTGPDYPAKVKRMSAEQIYAIYTRLLNAGKFNQKG